MQYESPRSIDDAVRLLARANGDARVLAGGTDLIVQMHAGARSPAVVIDVKRIPELMRIETAADGFRVGAAVPCAELTDHAGFAAAWPGVAEAADLIGSVQIQGRASLGGNLCNASPAADSVPAMIAAGARCTVVGPQGRREIAAEDVGTAPGKTSLKPGELMIAIRFPKPPPRSADAYLRLIPRSEMDIAVVGAGVALALDGAGRCTAARVAVAAVAPRALLVAEAGQALVGSTLDEAALERMAAAVRAACRPIDDKRGSAAYRTRVAGVLAKRAALIASERARSHS